MSSAIVDSSIGYCAGAVVSLIKPFKKGRDRVEIRLSKRDELALNRARRFLEEALAGGPYYSSRELNLMSGDELRADTAWIGLRILLQMAETQIDSMDFLERKLKAYIDILSKMERWELLKKEEDQSTLNEVDTFFRKLMDYSDAEEYRAALA